jgi:hypothetical protein
VQYQLIVSRDGADRSVVIVKREGPDRELAHDAEGCAQIAAQIERVFGEPIAAAFGGIEAIEAKSRGGLRLRKPGHERRRSEKDERRRPRFRSHVSS